MGFTRKWIVFASFLLACSLQAQLSRVNKQGDFQIWLSNSYYLANYYHSFSLYGKAEFRLGDDASTLYQKFGELLLDFKPLSWLTISPGYRNFVTRQLGGGWKTIPIPLLDIFFEKKIAKHISFNQRNRIQYEIPPNLPNTIVYRGRVQLRFPFPINQMQFIPIISDEMFFVQYRGFAQNRFIIGMIFPSLKHVAFTTYYQLRNLKVHHEWRYQNNLGLDLRINF